jgi:ABC-type multidrug transport system fused ATPase/permease subunit
MFAAFGLYGFLAYRALQGLMTVGDLVMFYQGIQRGQNSLSQLLASIAVLYENNLFLSNIHEFLALKPKVTDSVHPVKPAGRIRQGILFHDVRFGYPNLDRMVLDTINLHIRPGEHIALVGENGCGKTTLVKPLSRLYDPTAGSITLDAKSEYEVFKKFHQLSLGRTVIMISHRLSTVKMADRIYFLENGTIIESGSHGELIDQGGKYAYMFERQAQYYR